MRETTEPKSGQIWCWGSYEHGKRLERLWLLVDVFPCITSNDALRDGLAVNLENGTQRPVFNLPAISRDEESAFIDGQFIAWRRVL